jgi:moderate conductance mechanosensitive channel
MRLLLTLATGIALLICVAASAGWAKSPVAPAASAPAPPAEAGTPIELPQNLTPEQTRDLLSRLSDEQVRTLLLSQLDKAAAATALAPRSSNMVFDLMQSMHELHDRLDAMLSALPNLPSIGSFVLNRVTEGYEPDRIWTLAAEAIAMFVVALIGEALFRKLLRPVISHLPVLAAHSDFGKLGVLLLRAVIRVIELAVFGVVAVVAYFSVYDGHEAARLAFWTIFLFIVLLRSGSIVLRLLLAPHSPALRLPSVDTATARRLYRDFLFLAAVSLFGALASHFLTQIDVAAALMLAFGQILFLVNLTAIIAVIWRRRFCIAHLVGVRTPASGNNKPMRLGGLFAAYWHVFAICYVLAVGVLGTADRLLTGETQAIHVIPTLGLLCAIPLIDGLLRMAVRNFFGGRAARGLFRWAASSIRL